MSIEISNESKVLTETYTFSWRIDGFGDLPFVAERPLYSHQVHLGPGYDRPWQLLVSKERTDDGEPSIGFRLVRLGDGDCFDVVNFSVVLKSDDGVEEACVSDEEVSVDVEFKPYTFVTKSDFSSGKDFFQEKNLTIVCKMKYLYVTNTGDFVVEDIDEDHLGGFTCLFNSKKHSDAVFVLNEVEYFVHKCILSCRGLDVDSLVKSGVLELFENRKEKDEPQVPRYRLKADDMSGLTLSTLMSYLYCGILPDYSTPLELEELVKACKRLCLEHFREVCALQFKLSKKLSLCGKCNVLNEKEIRNAIKV